MASATKRKTSSNKKGRTSNASPKKTVKNTSTGKTAGTSPYKHQLAAILLFAAGLLLCALAFISGTNFWKTAHLILLGLFGFPAYFVGLLVVLTALLYASGKTKENFHHKVWQLVLLFLFVCAQVQLLTHPLYGNVEFYDCLQQIWQFGIIGQGGGMIGGLISLPMEYAFGFTASAVVLGILIFVLALIFTGSTLLGFFRGIAKPVKHIEQSVKERKQLHQATDRNIDIPLDDMPSHPVSTGKFFVPNIDNPKAVKNKKKKQQALESDDNVILKEETPSFDNAKLIKQQPLDDLVKQAQVTNESSDSFNMIMPKSKETPLSENYVYPPVTLLKNIATASNTDVSSELRLNADRLVDTLKSFGVETRIINICRGPSVTRYELQPSAGVKISKITNLADDIALNLAAGGIRIEAPIPNKAAVGIEVPNRKKDMVSLREIVASDEFCSAKSPLTFSLGKDIAGNVTVTDIAKMPHVLIAGATGSGKSVCINSMIVSLLYKSSPDDIRLLMIDPKVVELGVYNGIPHLLVPVVTDAHKAAGALGWAVTEMLKRYKLFAKTGVRDLKGYNHMAKNGGKDQEGEPYSPMPQIVIIIDELADLMMAASREVEDSICRLAQMARAAGMHLVIATQRPSVDVITGVIKANIPSRIAFTVSSQVDSRTILDGGGAEKLLGKGDMLFNPIDQQKPIRIQGCFVSDAEVEKVVEFIKSHEKADYSDDILQEIEKQAASNNTESTSSGEDQDAMIPAAIEAVVDAGQASTSFLQRKLKLGYARAARIMDEMETRGIVGPQDGSKPREVLISRQQFLEMQLAQKEEK